MKVDRVKPLSVCAASVRDARCECSQCTLRGALPGLLPRRLACGTWLSTQDVEGFESPVLTHRAGRGRRHAVAGPARGAQRHGHGPVARSAQGHGRLGRRQLGAGRRHRGQGPALLGRASTSRRWETCWPGGDDGGDGGEPVPRPWRPGRAAVASEVLRLQDSVTAVAQCPKPVIAAVHGYCIGGGVDLIAACDIRLASADAVFSVREAKVAIVADLGSLQRLPAIISAGHLAELAFTGKDITRRAGQGDRPGQRRGRRRRGRAQGGPRPGRGDRRQLPHRGAGHQGGAGGQRGSDGGRGPRLRGDLERRACWPPTTWSRR